MNREKAIKTLTDYNKWRRDENVPTKYPRPYHEDIGEAIDKAIEILKKQ